MMPSKPLQPGDPLRLGRFELLGRLGEGGQGVVYLGRGPGPGEERVAVKVLRSSVDATVLQRLGLELDAIHQVQPFVTAGVIEASAEGDRRYIVSEFIDGPSLQDRVDAQGPLAGGDLQRLAVGTATALTAIHGAGVVHRDFKPANVLLGPDGPRVVDFGIARLTDATAITSGLIGTPTYVAPEQLGGARPTSAIDVFAWGVTMIFAATGRSAFNADTVPAIMHRILYSEPDLTGVPPSLLPAVRQCLEKDPARRPSARDLLLRLVDPSARRPPEPFADPPPSADPYRTATSRIDPAPSGPGRSDPGRSDPGRSDPGRTGPVGAGPWRTNSLPSMAEPAPSWSASPPVSSPAPSRSGRGPALAIAGAIVAAALIVGGVLFLTRGSPTSPAATAGHSAAAGPSSAAGPTSAAEPASAAGRAGNSSSASTPATGPVIPASFAGTWAGTATMASISDPSVGLPNGISFTFAAGAQTVHENDQSCVNTLTLTTVTATVLTFSEPATVNCVAGTDTFTRHGPGLAYRWTDNIEQNTAILRKG
jgi:serine/threonine protein kinase